MNKKTFVSLIVALALCLSCCLSLVVSADSQIDTSASGHHGGGGKSRFVPYAPFNDYLNYLDDNGSSVADLVRFYQGFKVIAEDATNSIGDSTDDMLNAWDKFKSYLSDYMYSNVVGQRVIDLVDYANQSTTGLTTGKAVISFIAKRSLTLSYDEDNQPDLVETDTMYFWKDENHTIASDFAGVQLGDFYMMPNTVFVIREFSDGRDTIMFYADASQFTLTYSNAVSGFDNQPFTIRMSPGTYTCVNSDGSVDSITFENSNSYLSFQALKNSSVNSIDAGDALARQAMYNTHFSDYTTDGILPNISIITCNAQRSDGSRLLPNNYSGGQNGSFGIWYLSSGGFFPRNNSTTSLTFNTQSDTTIDPKKPPAIINPDTRLNVNTLLTTANVDNYADFGVTYNSVTGKFDLDINALSAKLADDIVPQFEAVFNGTYESQPDINSNNWSTDYLTNNYVQDYDNMIIDIDNKVQEIIDSRSPVWVPPRYPAVNTSAFIPAQVPTIPTNTLPTITASPKWSNKFQPKERDSPI